MFICTIVWNLNHYFWVGWGLSRGYMGRKLESNMECEIFQVLLEEAHESYATEIVRALPGNTIEDMSNNVEILGDWIRAWSPTEMDDSWVQPIVHIWLSFAGNILDHNYCPDYSSRSYFQSNLEIENVLNGCQSLVVTTGQFLNPRA